MQKRRDYMMQKQIDRIMGTFDFSRVSKAMRALDWKLGSLENAHFPDEDELRKDARSLLESIVGYDCPYMTHYGFHAFFKDDYLTLHFSIDNTGIKYKR